MVGPKSMPTLLTDIKQKNYTKKRTVSHEHWLILEISDYCKRLWIFPSLTLSVHKTLPSLSLWPFAVITAKNSPGSLLKRIGNICLSDMTLAYPCSPA